MIKTRQANDAERKGEDADPDKKTVYLDSIRALNSVPPELIVTPEVVFPPKKRYLQMRFHPELRPRLEYRAWLKNELNKGLLEKGFTDIETPTLFKSTPEGAREFLVPTRKKYRAYALAQSPQQYKQALMASGFNRYMQWARCYRDEDSRADRQPEFTQLDMEWAFAGAEQVQKDINDIILQALSRLNPLCYEEIRGSMIPMVRNIQEASAFSNAQEIPAHTFTRLTFAESIAAYGSDKPDLRIPGRIHAIEDIEPYRTFVSKITHHRHPLVECFAFKLEDVSVYEAREFVVQFMHHLPDSMMNDPDGTPQVLIYDSRKPLSGFSSVGFEYEAILDKLADGQHLEDGDLVVFKARAKPKGQYCSGSTVIGDLRIRLWKALVEAGHMPKPPRLGDPGSLQFAWITEFPMFKPTEENEPGQEGAAGIAASHHPFTAPLSTADLKLLFTDPLAAKSAAYDLVLNGVEIGGGSVRNHIADIQHFIMRDVLQMTEKRLNDFNHLFEVLKSGCPPHAGFALGFDRMVALMTDTSTVRDVIAFPKTMKGEDPFCNSPGSLSDTQLAPYGLQRRLYAKTAADGSLQKEQM